MCSKVHLRLAKFTVEFRFAFRYTFHLVKISRVTLTNCHSGCSIISLKICSRQYFCINIFDYISFRCLKKRMVTFVCFIDSTYDKLNSKGFDLRRFLVVLKGLLESIQSRLFRGNVVSWWRSIVALLPWLNSFHKGLRTKCYVFFLYYYPRLLSLKLAFMLDWTLVVLS